MTRIRRRAVSVGLLIAATFPYLNQSGAQTSTADMHPTPATGVVEEIVVALCTTGSSLEKQQLALKVKGSGY